MSSLRELLLVTYHFPPIGGSGVQRVLKLARYLPRFGWRAHVVCCGHTQYPLQDPTMTAEAGNETVVYRTRGWEPGGLAARVGGQVCTGRSGDAWSEAVEDGLSWRLSRLLDQASLPEHELLWVPSAIEQARRIARTHPIEAIITSGPPHCTHWVGESLKRRMGTRWLADLRDPILDNWARQRDGRIRRRYWRWLENAVAGRADHVVTTCREAMIALGRRHPSLGTDAHSCIPNGFDPEDAPRDVSPAGGDCCTFVHVGAFYREQSVGPILEAFRRVCDQNPRTVGLIRLRLIGSLSATQRTLIHRDDARFLDRVGYLPHGEAIAETAAADVAILMTPNIEAGRFCIPAKTFEYLAFGRHVLGIVHAGTQLAAILRDAGNTTVLESRDAGVLAGSIMRLWESWERGSLQAARDRAVVDQFRRDRQVREFADRIEDCVGRGAGLRLIHADPVEETVPV